METAHSCFRYQKPRGQFTSGWREQRKRSPNAHAQLRGNTLKSVGGLGESPCARLRPPSPSASTGGARTSAGRSPSSADVGSRTRSSSRLRTALPGCCVAFPSSFTPRSRRRPERRRKTIPAACCRPARPPLGRPVRRRQSAARARLALV